MKSIHGRRAVLARQKTSAKIEQWVRCHPNNVEIFREGTQRGAVQSFWRLSAAAIAPIVFFEIALTFAIGVSEIASSQSLVTSATVAPSSSLVVVFCQVPPGVWGVVLLCEGGTNVVCIFV